MVEAHTIKGMVGIFSIGEAFEAAKKIELNMRENNLDGVNGDLADLQAKMKTLVEALAQWRSA